MKYNNPRIYISSPWHAKIKDAKIKELKFRSKTGNLIFCDVRPENMPAPAENNLYMCIFENVLAPGHKILR